MAEINNRSSLHDSQLAGVLDSLLTDVTNVRSALNVAVSKLNADGGVSDTNYALATALTTTT